MSRFNTYDTIVVGRRKDKKKMPAYSRGRMHVCILLV